MSNLKRKPQQERKVSIYNPDCAVISPDVITDWLDDIELKPKDYEKYADDFLTVIPSYYCEGDEELSGPPEFWQRNLLSYSFFFGLGVTIFDRHLAKNLLFGLAEGWSRYVLFWLSEVRKSDYLCNNHLWTHAVNVLTALTGVASPDTTGPDTNAELVKQRATISGFTPAIRLGLNDPEYARALFEGATGERDKCDDEELESRIYSIQTLIQDAYSKNQARSSN
jgi:hypothetical protein